MALVQSRGAVRGQTGPVSTDLLFLRDAYLRSFEAEVIGSDEGRVALDRTDDLGLEAPEVRVTQEQQIGAHRA
ncbi:MAG: hypothetical protein AAGK32_13075, partial [Actinomycetota bacterium]